MSSECEMDSGDSLLIPSGDAWCTKCLEAAESQHMDRVDPVRMLNAAARHVSDLTTERLRLATVRLIDAAVYLVQMNSVRVAFSATLVAWIDLEVAVNRYKQVVTEQDDDFSTHLQLSILVNVAEGKTAGFVAEGWTPRERGLLLTMRGPRQIAKAIVDEGLTGGAA